MTVQGIQSLIIRNDKLTIQHSSRINITGWLTSGSFHSGLYQRDKETCRYYEYCNNSTANGIKKHTIQSYRVRHTSFSRRRIHISFIRRRFRTCSLDIYQILIDMCHLFEIPSLCVKVGIFNTRRLDERRRWPPSFTVCLIYQDYIDMCHANETKL